MSFLKTDILEAPEAEKIITGTIARLSDLILYRMELTGDFDGWGRDEVIESYCRSVFELPADKPLSQRNTTFFRALVVSRRMDNHLLSLSPEELQEKIVACAYDFGVFYERGH